MTSTALAQHGRTLRRLRVALDLATAIIGAYTLASFLVVPQSPAQQRLEIVRQARAAEPHRATQTAKPKAHRRQKIDLGGTDCRLGALD